MAGMSYQQFGSAFVHDAVAPARIRKVIRDLAGDAVKVGPIQVGPGRVATAVATGTIAEPVIERTTDDPLGYQVRLPVALDLDVLVAGAHHHYSAQAEVRIAIAVVLAEPLSICVEPTAPTARDVTVKLHAKGLSAKLLARVGDIDNELRREIASYVENLIDSERSQFANVDLRPMILAAWPTD